MAFLEFVNPDYVLGAIQLVIAVTLVLILHVQRQQAKKCQCDRCRKKGHK